MIITNAKAITFDQTTPFIFDCEIQIINGTINKIATGHSLTDRFPGESRLDAKGHFVLPGNICAHTHFYGAFARGLGIPGEAPDAFPAILEKLWWKLDKSLALKDVELSAQVCLLDAIKHGTTTLIDHHASPNAINNSLNVIADAVIETGLRASLCYEVTDRDGRAKAREGIKENIRFIDSSRRNPSFGQMIAAMFGLHASLTLSDDTLQECRQAAPEDVGFHIHVAEHSIDEYDSLRKSGMRAIERLYKYGILGEKSIVAHAVHVDAKEMDILKNSRTWVTHQPRSNMNNAVGMSSVESMLDFGIRVGLGNDGFSNAMWDEWRAAYLAHKLWHLDPRRMGADRIARMAVENNSELVRTLFGGLKVGKVVEGAAADLIIIDYQPFTEVNAGNLPWHIVFGFRDGMVETTIVNGKILMENREIKTMDEQRIIHDAMQSSKEVWKKYNAQY